MRQHTFYCLFFLILIFFMGLYVYYDLKQPQTECIEGYVQNEGGFPDPMGRFICTKTR